MRVSSGDLCEAEAPTEAGAETLFKVGFPQVSVVTDIGALGGGGVAVGSALSALFFSGGIPQGAVFPPA